MTTSYDIDDEYSTTPDDLLLAGSDGYLSGGSSGRNVFWDVKENSTYKIYFVTDPWTKGIDHGWWNWREVFALEGLAGGIELPGGQKGFPVRDQRIVETENGPRRQDIPVGSPEADQLLKMVVPYIPRGETKRKTPFRPVKDKIGANVVEIAEDGTAYHKVMVFSLTRYRKLNEAIESYREMVGDAFSLIGHPWTLSISGKGAAEMLSLRPQRDEPPIDLPEPIDIPEKLREKRQAIFELIGSLKGIDTKVYADEDHAVEAETTEPGEVSAPAEAVVEAPMDREELYATWTDARIKTLLTKKGVSTAPKTPREELLALARENGL